MTETDLEKKFADGMDPNSYIKKRKRMAEIDCVPKTIPKKNQNKKSTLTAGGLAYNFKFHLFDVLGRDSLTRIALPSLAGQSYMLRLCK